MTTQIVSGGAPAASLRRVLRPIVRPMRRLANPHFDLGLPYAPDRRTARLIKTVTPYTMLDPLRLATLYGLAREVLTGEVAGDIVETGVCNGGSAALLGAAIKDWGAAGAGRTLWLYDSFEGMPPTVDKDGAGAREAIGAAKGTLDSVLAALNTVGFPRDEALIRVGLFESTFQQPLPRQVALIHVDCDWYEPVLLTFRTFYDRIPDGGAIVMDDFGTWEGSREAFYEFCEERKIRPLLERIGYSQAFWIKGREHSRFIQPRYESGVYRP
jgi:O-methyltransferase